MSDIFRVTVTRSMYVIADDRDHSEVVALQHWQEDTDEVRMISAFFPVQRQRDVDPDYINSRPFYDMTAEEHPNPEEKTIKELLDEENKEM